MRNRSPEQSNLCLSGGLVGPGGRQWSVVMTGCAGDWSHGEMRKSVIVNLGLPVGGPGHSDTFDMRWWEVLFLV